jgi:hypothetical protein
MALLAFGGCSSSSASAGPTTPVSPSAVGTETPPPSVVATSAAALPSFLTSGYSTPEDAVRAWVEGRGDVYAGECGSGSGEAGQVCSMAEGEGTYSVGLVMSEFAWLLHLEKVGDLWYVAEVTDPPAPA